MNRLVKYLGSCDLQDVTSLRVLYNNNEGNLYSYEGIEIVCGETHKTTPEFVRFTLKFPLALLGLADWNLGSQSVAAADFCLREFASYLEEIDLERSHQTGKEKFTGKFFIHTPPPKMVARNSAYLRDGYLHISLTIRFPVHMMAKRNVVQGSKSVKLVRKELGRAIRLFIAQFDHSRFREHIQLEAFQQAIRELLPKLGLVSFIANGSILPRAKGTELPLQNAIPFQSPAEDEVELEVLGLKLRGMGIKEGVTVITGGGYSGKSTLMEAMFAGVYNHIPGDGREFCLTNQTSVKICAEDGRPVTGLNIEAFIRSISGVNTKEFTTGHASGSTSQAANIMEAIAFGGQVLLIDEDKTATNFMIRDARMKKIIHNDPIIPFTDRVRQLYRETGISTVLIIGGSSEYMDIADHVYYMNHYRLENYTRQAEDQRLYPYEYYEVKDDGPVLWYNQRTIQASTFSTYRRQAEDNKIKERLEVHGTELILIGDEEINISGIHSLISPDQARAAAFIIRAMAVRNTNPHIPLLGCLEQVYQQAHQEGLDWIFSPQFPQERDLELPRPIDVLSVVARMRWVEYLEHTLAKTACL